MRTRVQIERGWLLAEIGRVADARDLLHEAHETATRLGDRGLAAHARVEAALQARRFSVFDVEELRATALEAIDAFTELRDARGLADARYLLAITYDTGSGRYGAALAELEQALVDAVASGEALIRSRIVARLVMNLTSGPTPAEEAIRRCEELRRASNGQPVLEAKIERCLSQLCAMAARPDEAREHETQASAVLDQLPYADEVASRRFAAQTHLLLGDTAAAERQLLAMWQYFGGASDGARNQQSVFTASMLALFCCDEGRWDDAEHWHSCAAGVPVPFGNPVAMLRPAVGARVAAHRGELGAAVALARKAVEVAEQTDSLNWSARVWLALAEVQRTSGETAEADTTADTAIQLYEQKGNVTAAARVRAAAQEAANSG